MYAMVSSLLRDALRRLWAGTVGGAAAEALWQLASWLGWIRGVAWGIPFLTFACIVASNAEGTRFEGPRGVMGLVLVSAAIAAIFAVAIWGAVSLAGGDARPFAKGFFWFSLGASLATAAVGRWRRARHHASG